MPSHIHFLVGDYPAMIEANHKATDADAEFLRREGHFNFRCCSESQLPFSGLRSDVRLAKRTGNEYCPSMRQGSPRSNVQRTG